MKTEACNLSERVINADTYLFTIREVCRILRLGRPALMEIIGSGELPVIVHRNQNFIMHSDLKQYLNNRCYQGRSKV